MKSTRGFTLMELLIVVVIVGVLASLVIPRMSAQTEKANVMEAMTFLGTMRKGQMQLYNQKGEEGYVYIPPGLPCSASLPSCTATPQDNDLARTNWALLGITVPDYSRPNSVWVYVANDGRTLPHGLVKAIRTFPGTIKSKKKTDDPPRGYITLDTDGTWGGFLDYAQAGDDTPAGPYAPTK